MRYFIQLAVVAVVLAIAPAAFAADAPKIAIVDVQALMGKSKAGKSIESQVNKQRESFKGEFTKLEKELVDLRKGLEKIDQKSEEFATKRKDLEKRMLEANGLVQQRRQALDKGAAKAIMDLEREIVIVVGEMAKAEGYALVVRSQSVVVAANELDITDKALAALDKKVSDIKVSVESPAAAKADPKKKG